MNKKTLKALEGSIEKWRKIVAKEGVDESFSNCPLCKIFIDNFGCDGCPVAESKGTGGCSDTPYESWGSHQAVAHNAFYNGKIYCPECEDLARAELKFLEGLRP